MVIFRNLSVMVSCLSILLLFISSCTNSSEPEKQQETQLSEEQAQAYFQENSYLLAQLTYFLASDMVQGTKGNVDDMYDLGGISTLGNSRFLKGKQISALLKSGLSDTVYYKGNGCWYLEILESQVYLNSDIKGDICFGSVDEMGYPLASNDIFDFILDGIVSIDYSDESYTQLSSFDVVKDFNMTGIEGFNKETGMITANGTQTEEVKINLGSTEGSFSSTFKISYTVEEFKVDPMSDYPAGGGFQFQLALNASETGSQPVSYLINGAVGFNGTEIADVTFNGYKFNLNLSDYYSN
jgi:hypothetical protein